MEEELKSGQFKKINKKSWGRRRPFVLINNLAPRPFGPGVEIAWLTGKAGCAGNRLIFQFADLPVVAAAAVEPVYPLFQFIDALFVPADLPGGVPTLAIIVAAIAVVATTQWGMPEQRNADSAAAEPLLAIPSMPGLKIQGSGQEQPDDRCNYQYSFHFVPPLSLSKVVANFSG
jgi:hypothetical protein